MYIAKIVVSSIIILIGLWTFPFSKEDRHKKDAAFSSIFFILGGGLAIFFSSWIILVSSVLLGMGIVALYVLLEDKLQLKRIDAINKISENDSEEMTLEQSKAPILMNEMLFITKKCMDTCVDSEKCSPTDFSKITTIVSAVFMALIFAELKYQKYMEMYNAFAEEVKKVIPLFFGGPDATNIAFDMIKGFEIMLYDEEIGEVISPNIWGIFYDINGGSILSSGPCDLDEINKAILNHFQFIQELISDLNIGSSDT